MISWVETVDLRQQRDARVEEKDRARRERRFEPPTGFWIAVRTGPSLALMRKLQSHRNAKTLRAKIMNNLAHQKHQVRYPHCARRFRTRSCRTS